MWHSRVAPTLALALCACGGTVGTTNDVKEGGADATVDGGFDAAREASIDVAMEAEPDSGAEAEVEAGCVPGTAQCDGNTPWACNSSGVRVDGTPCPFLCEGGQCVGVCNPGSKTCNGNAVRVCDPSGQWSDAGACPYVCDAGVCTGSCVPGTTSCCNTGTTPPSCGNNSVYVVGPCSSSFAVATGTCGAAGEWTIGTACNTCWISDGGSDCVVTCQQCLSGGSFVATCQVPGDSGLPGDVCACP